MKLSEKGVNKIYDIDFDKAQGFPLEYEDIDFEPDDFEGVVVLTIEEAKLIVKALECLEADVEGIDETSHSLIKSRCARYHLENRIKALK